VFWLVYVYSEPYFMKGNQSKQLSVQWFKPSAGGGASAAGLVMYKPHESSRVPSNCVTTLSRRHMHNVGRIARRRKWPSSVQALPPAVLVAKCNHLFKQGLHH